MTELALATPAAFAKLVHTPVVHASHCGQVAAFRIPDAGKLQIRQLVGGAQTVDEKGRVLALRVFSEGAGIVVSDIPISPTGNGKTVEYPSGFWIPDLPESYLHAWKRSIHRESATMPTLLFHIIEKRRYSK